MKKRERIITVVVTAVAVLLVVGVTALSAGVFGSRSDPLVTLSYINDTVKPELESYAEEQAGSVEEGLTKTFDTKLQEYSSQVEEQLTGSTVYGSDDVFATVELKDGETLKLMAGAELMLRSGSLKTASGITLTDTTSGTAVTKDGTALETNHMYLVTADGNLTVSGNVMVLVRGAYSIR